jgi:hypothetical protein
MILALGASGLEPSRASPSDKIAPRMRLRLIARSAKRTSGVRHGRRLAFASAFLSLALGALSGSAIGCRESSPSAMASRILARYQRQSGSKPLTAGGMIRLRLFRVSGETESSGSSEILWEPFRYRESVSSASWTSIRGIETGRAYLTDPDGVTRVVSDPVLRELTTRSYFWRRAWLFQDREGARVRLGPAEGDSVSVSLQPSGGFPVLLTFSSRDGSLRSARSPRFDLEFSSTTRFEDRSDPAHPFDGEVAWTGLPTGDIPHASVGGGRARFAETSSRIPFERAGGALVVPARVGGEVARLAADAAADGFVRVSAALGARLGLAWRPDVLGRRIASGVTLELGAVRYPGLFVEEAGEGSLPPGADAMAGACLFREAIVEIDPDARVLGLHDPERWVIPEGYQRVVIDDDGDRPVAILDRGSPSVRVTLGSDLGDAALELAPESARRAGLTPRSPATGLLWGATELAPVALRVADRGYAPDWGDDGRMGIALLLRFHAYVDMPRRWVYLLRSAPGAAGVTPANR